MNCLNPDSEVYADLPSVELLESFWNTVLGVLVFKRKLLLEDRRGVTRENLEVVMSWEVGVAGTRRLHGWWCDGSKPSQRAWTPPGCMSDTVTVLVSSFRKQRVGKFCLGDVGTRAGERRGGKCPCWIVGCLFWFWIRSSCSNRSVQMLPHSLRLLVPRFAFCENPDPALYPPQSVLGHHGDDPI